MTPPLVHTLYLANALALFNAGLTAKEPEVPGKLSKETVYAQQNQLIARAVDK